MKKRIRKICAVTFCLCLIVAGMSACGKDSSNQSTVTGRITAISDSEITIAVMQDGTNSSKSASGGAMSGQMPQGGSSDGQQPGTPPDGQQSGSSDSQQPGTPPDGQQGGSSDG